MESGNVLIDTNIVIEFLRKKDKQNSYLWKIMESSNSVFVSTITVFELYAGAITKQHIEDLKRILKWFEITPLTYEISKISAEIYKNLKKENKLIEFRDIFIAATSIDLDISLITYNIDHFKRINNLKLIDKDQLIIPHKHNNL